VAEFDPELIVPDPTLSLARGAVRPWRAVSKKDSAFYRQAVDDFCARFEVDPNLPFAEIPAAARAVLLEGGEVDGKSFEGVLPNLRRRITGEGGEALRGKLEPYLTEQRCPDCRGARLRPEVLAVRLTASPEPPAPVENERAEAKRSPTPPALPGRSIADLSALTVAAASAHFNALAFDAERAAVAAPILAEVRRRLAYLVDVGVGYLTLDRNGTTLSGGETQRIRLAGQVGNGLVGVCYVLDEPTIGLHQRDNARLIGTLRRLADAGNTVLVVEHDEDVIRAADHVIDVGPGAGSLGGKIVAQGTLAEILADANSPTGNYLSGRKSIAVPTRRRPTLPDRELKVLGARANNLKNIDVSFPLGVLCCVTGVSGSGKSTLVNEVLLRGLRRRLARQTAADRERLDGDGSGGGGGRQRPGEHDRILGVGQIERVIEIDQVPLGRGPRSNPGTYTGAFDAIRAVYAKTREAKLRGYDASRFSFNVKGGRCEACQGQGTKRIEMHFLPDVFVACSECRGRRYNRETLEIRYRGKDISEVLDMRVEEAVAFFDAHAAVKPLLTALRDVGLGYITLGQSSAMLSGGEAQRVKLAAELGKPTSGHTLYVLDEPTTGLHFADIARLMSVLNRLVDLGHSVLVIEHSLDVIKCADWVVDLGPEGGDGGGRVVAQGMPEQVAAVEASHTGRYLREKLAGAGGPR
jgi:excinuclease ABC subunit A